MRARADIRAIVIDDDPVSNGLIRGHLRAAGVRMTHEFDNPLEAIRVIDAEGRRSDVVFCDLQIPSMDGVEIIRELARVRYAGAFVPVSGEDERILNATGRLAAAHQLLVLGALRKPVQRDAVQTLLRLHASRATSVAPVVRRSYTVEELEQAILQRQIVNHYQAKVIAATGTIAGVEALARWEHPADGLVGPQLFIPLAEASGLMRRVTWTVIDNALRDAAGWQLNGMPIHVAINVSMEDLRDVTFPDALADAAARAGVTPSTVILEVTESRLMTDQLKSLDVLTRLRLKRFGVSIDDFGTGHSSLTNLHGIPFNELKIAREFVHGVSREADLQAIFDASVAMARQLGMRVVAEGVEDYADWAYVRTRTDLAQGYYIGKPMPPSELPSSRAKWNARLAHHLGK